MDSGGDRDIVFGLQLVRRGVRTGLPRTRSERGRAGASERVRKRRALHRCLPRGRNSHGLGAHRRRPNCRSMAPFCGCGRESWVRSLGFGASAGPAEPMRRWRYRYRASHRLGPRGDVTLVSLVKSRNGAHRCSATIDETDECTHRDTPALLCAIVSTDSGFTGASPHPRS